MSRACLALVFGCTLFHAASAGAMDPKQAGKEAQEDLKALLDEQRREKDAPEVLERPASPPPQRPANRHDTTGSELPAICIGC